MRHFQATFSEVIAETRKIGFSKCRVQMIKLGTMIRKGMCSADCIHVITL